MSPPKVLISGAGIAGLTLAHWLARFGASVKVIDRAPALRNGGQAVDFRGSAHLRILREMGVLESLESQQTRMAPLTFLGGPGVPRATLSSEFAGGDIEVLRGTLINVLANAVSENVVFVFDESINSLEESRTSVTVTFRDRSKQDFDIVVGADGLHSNVRRLRFDEDEKCLRQHGYGVVSFPIPSEPWSRYAGQFSSSPGRCAGISGTADGKAVGATFFLTVDGLDAQLRHPSVARQVISDRFRSHDWIVPDLIQLLNKIDDVYADTISSVEVQSVSAGRVVLVGDAAYGGTIGGMGTGAALVGAYLLAHELVESAFRYDAAFTKYQARFDAYARSCQRGAAAVGPFFAPRTGLAIFRRNLLLRMLEYLPGKGLMERLANSRATGINLPDYVLTKPAP